MTAKRTQRVLKPSATRIIASTFAGASAKPNPQIAAESLARGTTIVGKMFEGLSDQYSVVGQKYAKWVTNFGGICWHIVELSVPRSLGDIFLRYWLKLATVIAVAFIILGIFTKGAIEWQTGLALLALIVLISLVRAYLRRFMLKLPLRRRITIAVGIVAVLITILFCSALVLGLHLEYTYLTDWLRKEVLDLHEYRDRRRLHPTTNLREVRPTETAGRAQGSLCGVVISIVVDRTPLGGGSLKSFHMATAYN